MTQASSLRRVFVVFASIIGYASGLLAERQTGMPRKGAEMENGMVSPIGKNSQQNDGKIGFDEYQVAASRTANLLLNGEKRTLIAGLGLCGEAGEVAELLKKWHGHGHEYDEEKLIKELGDVLWYLSEICTLHGISLKMIAEMNYAKLLARYPNGFREIDSVMRRK